MAIRSTITTTTINSPAIHPIQHRGSNDRRRLLHRSRSLRLTAVSESKLCERILLYIDEWNPVPDSTGLRTGVGPDSTGVGPESDRIRPKLLELDRIRSKLTGVGPDSTEVTGVGPDSTGVYRSRTGFDRGGSRCKCLGGLGPDVFEGGVVDGVFRPDFEGGGVVDEVP